MAFLGGIRFHNPSYMGEHWLKHLPQDVPPPPPGTGGCAELWKEACHFCSREPDDWMFSHKRAPCQGSWVRAVTSSLSSITTVAGLPVCSGVSLPAGEKSSLCSSPGAWARGTTLRRTLLQTRALRLSSGAPRGGCRYRS